VISFKKKKILVTDDEPGYQEVLRDEFRMADATVLTAGNGSQALDILKNEDICAIISDVRMPGGNGIELLDRVKTKNEKTPIVMLITGFADLEPEDGYDKGAEAIFSKPCNLDQLVEAIYRASLPEKERFVQKYEVASNDFQIKLRVKSFDDAIQKKLFSMGRGGMFLPITGKLPCVGMRVSFLMTSNLISKTIFEGIGICRWSRAVAEPNLPTGIGIEFTHLTEKSYHVYSKLMSKGKPRAFIPKGIQKS